MQRCQYQGRSDDADHAQSHYLDRAEQHQANMATEHRQEIAGDCRRYAQRAKTHPGLLDHA